MDGEPTLRARARTDSDALRRGEDANVHAGLRPHSGASLHVRSHGSGHTHAHAHAVSHEQSQDSPAASHNHSHGSNLDQLVSLGARDPVGALGWLRRAGGRVCSRVCTHIRAHTGARRPHVFTARASRCSAAVLIPITLGVLLVAAGLLLLALWRLSPSSAPFHASPMHTHVCENVWALTHVAGDVHMRSEDGRYATLGSASTFASVASLVLSLAEQPCTAVTLIMPAITATDAHTHARTHAHMRADESHMAAALALARSTADGAALDCADPLSFDVMSVPVTVLGVALADAHPRVRVFTLTPPLACAALQGVYNPRDDSAAESEFSARWHAHARAHVGEHAHQVVHFHGAATVMALRMLHDSVAPVHRPACVYTVHDATQEVPHLLRDDDVPVQSPLSGSVLTPDGTPPLSFALLLSDGVTVASPEQYIDLMATCINLQDDLLVDVLWDALESRRVELVQHVLDARLDPAAHALPLIEAPHNMFRFGAVLQSKAAARSALVAAGVLPAAFSQGGGSDIVTLFIWDSGPGSVEVLRAGLAGACAAQARAIVLEQSSPGLHTAGPRRRGSRRLDAASLAPPGCSVEFIFIDDARQAYHRTLRAAADIVVLPYASDSPIDDATLALLFGSVVVAPASVAMRRLVVQYSGAAINDRRDVSVDGDSWTGLLFSSSVGGTDVRACTRDAVNAVRAQSTAEREVAASAMSFAQLRWSELTGPSPEYFRAYTAAVAGRRDADLRVFVHTLHHMDHVEEPRMLQLPWSANLLRWPGQHFCDDTPESTVIDTVAAFGPAGYELRSLPPDDLQATAAGVRDVIRGAYPPSPQRDEHEHIIVKDVLEGLLAAASATGVTGPLQRDMLHVKTTPAQPAGGAVFTVHMPKDAQRRFDVYANTGADESRRRIESAFLQSFADSGEGERSHVDDAALRAAAKQHLRVHEASRMASLLIVAVSAWSAPLTLLTRVSNGTYSLVVEAVLDDGSSVSAVSPPFPASVPGLWTQRHLYLVLARPFLTLRVSVRLEGLLGQVAFDDVQARWYMQ